MPPRAVHEGKAASATSPARNATVRPSFHAGLPCQPSLQAYAAWPTERLSEIGGSTAYYAQDFLARKEQGEARRARALEVSWCPQVGMGVRLGWSYGRRRARPRQAHAIQTLADRQYCSCFPPAAWRRRAA